MKRKFNNLFMLAFLAMATMSLVLVSCDNDDPDDVTLPPIGGYDSADDVASDNLIAAFSFEDNVDDAQGNTTGGTSVNTSFVDGAKGKAWQGSTDGYTVYDTPGSKLTGLQSFTVAFWINTTIHTDGAEGWFMLNNNSSWIGNFFIIQEAGTEGVDSVRIKVKFDNWNAAAWKEQWVELGGEYMLPNITDRWAHLAFSYDGSTSKFSAFLDGAKFELSEGHTDRYEDDPASGGAALGNLNFVDADKFIFGAYQHMVADEPNPDAWMKNFDGALDEFRIYDKALIDTDINALYELEKAGRMRVNKSNKQ